MESLACIHVRGSERQTLTATSARAATATSATATTTGRLLYDAVSLDGLNVNDSESGRSSQESQASGFCVLPVQNVKNEVLLIQRPFEINQLQFQTPVTDANLPVKELSVCFLSVLDKLVLVCRNRQSLYLAGHRFVFADNGFADDLQQMADLYPAIGFHNDSHAVNRSLSHRLHNFVRSGKSRDLWNHTVSH